MNQNPRLEDLNLAIPSRSAYTIDEHRWDFMNRHDCTKSAKVFQGAYPMSPSYDVLDT